MLNRSRVVARSWPPALWLLLIHNSVIIHKHDDDGKTVLKDHNDALSTDPIHVFFSTVLRYSKHQLLRLIANYRELCLK